MGRSVSFVEPSDWQPGHLGDSQPENPSLLGLLTLVATGMHRQSHHETNHAFLLRKILEVLIIQPWAPTIVIIQRAGDRLIGVANRYPNPYGSVIDTCQSPVHRKFYWSGSFRIFMMVFDGIVPKRYPLGIKAFSCWATPKSESARTYFSNGIGSFSASETKKPFSKNDVAAFFTRSSFIMVLCNRSI